MFELIEKKSKFYGYVFDVKSEEQVKNIVENLKKEHKKSNHVCYAYIIAENGCYAKAVDDGEPSGTAGKPIFNVIEKKNLKNIMVAVVRYFGGIKLGAGGLVRAYTKCASGAVDEYLKCE